MNAVYAVAVFSDKNGVESVNIVPQSWLKKEGDLNVCVWPLVKNHTKLIESCVPPSEKYKWRKHIVRPLRENIESYEQAKVIFDNALDGNDSRLSEISPSPSKRSRGPPARYSPSAVESTRKQLFSPTHSDGIGADVDSDSNNDSDGGIDLEAIVREHKSKPLHISSDSSDVEEHQNNTPGSKKSSGSPYPTPPTEGRERQISKKRNSSSRQRNNSGPQTGNQSVSVVPSTSGYQRTSSNGQRNNSGPRTDNQSVSVAPLTSGNQHTSSNGQRNNSGPQTDNQSVSVAPSNSDNQRSSSNGQRNDPGPQTDNQSVSVVPPTSGNQTPSAGLERKQFKAYWEKLNPDERQYYIAESGFLLRKFLASKRAALNVPETDPDLNVFPIDTDEKLTQTHERMVKITKFNEKVDTVLKKKGTNDINETMKNMCSYLFCDEWARGYSLFGFGTKKTFSELKIVQLLFTSASEFFNPQEGIVKVTDNQIKDGITAWLNHCNTRVKKQQAPKAKKRKAAREALVTRIPIRSVEEY